jgi:hypothetical protein
MVTIYILKLKNNKYYVGKTTNTIQRLEDHVDGIGCEWTKLYKPIELLAVHENLDAFDEDKYTISMMSKYGIDHVRGGSFVQLELSEPEKDIINKMIRCATDKCFACGKTGHFVDTCYKVKYSKKNYTTKKTVRPKSYQDSDTSDSDFEDFDVCYRCGREGHYANECYAKKSMDGRWIKN